MDRYGTYHALYAIVLLLLLSIISASIVYADSMQNNYDYSFLNVRDNFKKDLWTDAENSVNVVKGIYSLRLNTQTASLDYTKDFWMPIEPWEYEVCSRGLSTQLVSDDGSGMSSSGSGISGIYDDAATVVAYKRVPKNSNESILYEITWYFQPKGDDKDYSVDINGPSGTLNIQATTKAIARTGGSGYVAFYSNSSYNKAIITYNSAAHNYPIIATNDTNR